MWGGIAKDLVLLYRPGAVSRVDGRRNYASSECAVYSFKSFVFGHRRRFTLLGMISVDRKGANADKACWAG
jgi:hypothetical protein